MEFPTAYLEIDDVLEIFDALIGPAATLLRSRDLLEIGRPCTPAVCVRTGRLPNGRSQGVGISPWLVPKPRIHRWQQADRVGYDPRVPVSKRHRYRGADGGRRGSRRASRSRSHDEDEMLTFRDLRLYNRYR
jgi:hypothetical protein